MGQTLVVRRSGEWWRHWSLPLLLCVASIAVALFGDGAGEWLRYERAPIAAGEWWRLVSAHLVHLGWSHLWINLAGLMLVWALVGDAFRPRYWWGFVAFGSLGISLGLWWWLPDLDWYVGLSGLLHGMLLAGALWQGLRGEREALLIVLIVTSKVGWELWHGPLPGSREVAGGEVVVQGHALGLLCGALYVALLRLLQGARGDAN